MEIIRANNYDELSAKACELVLQQVQTARNSVVGLATGSTPEGLYQKLIEAYQNGQVSFKDLTTFNLDEYAGLRGDDPNSYRYYMNDKLFNHIDLPQNQAFLPNGNAADLAKECRDYDKQIRDAGYIDLQILGLGLNGHIGFNEPGTPFDSRTHVVELDDTTREANARFFPSKDDVPHQALTMGIGTIMESSQIVLLASGEKKADAVSKLVHGELTEAIPSSILQKHQHVTIIGDEEALSRI
ncbi:glucosamine-6-phosphate deaminase [Barrientosiimonas marina]|uniref:Glucosamine-6-phosphate deaminase n=1 Tax=Lentibacillus kimchii TaxID=1542911 RepID=A0ABW2UXG1_9BACI